LLTVIVHISRGKMGQTESRRCRICATKLNPKKKQDMEQSLCSNCRKKGSKAVWENRSAIKSIVFGGGKKEKKKKKKKGKKNKSKNKSG